MDSNTRLLLKHANPLGFVTAHKPPYSNNTLKGPNKKTDFLMKKIPNSSETTGTTVSKSESKIYELINNNPINN